MGSKKLLWNIVAAVLWGAVLVAALARAGLHPARPTSLTTYLTGGMAWRESQPLYTNWRGFLYPPVIAWFFGLFTRMPAGVAAVLWRMLAAGTYLAGLGMLLRAGVFRRIPEGRRGLVFLGALPLSIGNIDNGQANPLIAGLMMLAVASAGWEAWSVCAVAIGIATAFKIYPLALGMLLCVARPRELTWRVALVLAVLAAAPFALQDAHYVSGQYHAWLHTRMADDRFHYPMKDAPLDLWYLLVRLGNLPVSPRVYMAAQVAGGAGIAWWVWSRPRNGVDRREVLAGMYLLVSVWMLLLGPATENQTYVVLAPAACLVAVGAFAAEKGGAARVLGIAGFALLLAAAARNSLLPHLKSPGYMAIQPVGALILLAAVLAGGATTIRPRPR